MTPYQLWLRFALGKERYIAHMKVSQETLSRLNRVSSRRKLTDSEQRRYRECKKALGI